MKMGTPSPSLFNPLFFSLSLPHATIIVIATETEYSTPLRLALGDMLELICNENRSNLFIQVRLNLIILSYKTYFILSRT